MKTKEKRASYRKKRLQDLEYKARHQEYIRLSRNTSEYKVNRQKRRQLPEVKVVDKLRRKLQRQKPEYKVRHKNSTRIRRNTPEGKKRSSKNSANRRKVYKEKVFNHYGWICACCGETEPAFLTIDHINGGGKKHKKEIGIKTIYPWLIRNNFPDGFQTLCWNCNCSKGHLGYCPHTKKRNK